MNLLHLIQRFTGCTEDARLVTFFIPDAFNRNAVSRAISFEAIMTSIPPSNSLMTQVVRDDETNSFSISLDIYAFSSFICPHTHCHCLLFTRVFRSSRQTSTETSIDRCLSSTTLQLSRRSSCTKIKSPSLNYTIVGCLLEMHLLAILSSL